MEILMIYATPYASIIKLPRPFAFICVHLRFLFLFLFLLSLLSLLSFHLSNV